MRYVPRGWALLKPDLHRVRYGWDRSDEPIACEWCTPWRTATHDQCTGVAVRRMERFHEPASTVRCACAERKHRPG